MTKREVKRAFLNAAEYLSEFRALYPYSDLYSCSCLRHSSADYQLELQYEGLFKNDGEGPYWVNFQLAESEYTYQDGFTKAGQRNDLRQLMLLLAGEVLSDEV